ncbi:hypothetical protein DCC26_04890 [Auritidibacter sp. NML120779]|nr:hypothetical protein DCC26_04890 [Auritidibacter sp. NML120779]
MKVKTVYRIFIVACQKGLMARHMEDRDTQKNSLSHFYPDPKPLLRHLWPHAIHGAGPQAVQSMLSS